MSLVKLLAAGKSLVGIKDHASPYRLTNQRLLPTFGMERNPFCAVLPAQPTIAEARSTERPVSAAEGSHPSAPILRPIGVISGSGGSGEAKPSPMPGSAKRGLFENLRGWFGRPSLKIEKTGRRRLGKPLVQSELCLAEVRVVRNDLSDADFEVVRLRPAVARAGAKSLLVKQSKAASVWGRASVRWLGSVRT